jgi:hypothetical protein
MKTTLIAAEQHDNRKKPGAKPGIRAMKSANSL